MLIYNDRITSAALDVLRLHVCQFDDRLWQLENVKHLQPSIRFAIADRQDTADHFISDRLHVAYVDFKNKLIDQYYALVDHGFTIKPWHGFGSDQPYDCSLDMIESIDQFGTLYYFQTDHGFGNGDQVSADHPMVDQTGIVIDGLPVLYNDLFRAVHDLFGHYLHGCTFAPLGEYKAFIGHLQLFGIDSLASEALMIETIYQSTFFGFGRHIRRSDNTIPKPTETDYIELSDRPFADQKVFQPLTAARSLVPGNILKDGLFDV